MKASKGSEDRACSVKRGKLTEVEAPCRGRDLDGKVSALIPNDQDLEMADSKTYKYKVTMTCSGSALVLSLVHSLWLSELVRRCSGAVDRVLKRIEGASQLSHQVYEAHEAYRHRV